MIVDQRKFIKSMSIDEHYIDDRVVINFETQTGLGENPNLSLEKPE